MIGKLRNGLRFWRTHGFLAFVAESWARLSGKGRTLEPVVVSGPEPERRTWVTPRELLQQQSLPCRALRTFASPGDRPSRVNLVIDRMDRGSLYGETGIALVLAALLAQSRGDRVRIVTRAEAAQPGDVESVLSAYGLSLPEGMEFEHAPPHDTARELDLLDGELFITTSWWTTAAALSAMRPDQVLYLVQDDERTFYPYGDAHHQCSTVMRNPDLRFVVSSRLLFDHFAAGGPANIAQHGIWFEPAFPAGIFVRRSPIGNGRRTLAFDARPQSPRHLLFFGLEVLEAAVSRGIIDLAAWDIVLVGSGLPDLRLDDGRYTPRRLENPSWTEYAQFLGTVDLGLGLMYSPHPGYPVLDMAAGGAVVVTNRFAGKQDLSAYSRNILCGELELHSMLQALSAGVRLAQDAQTREANRLADGFQRDWRASFASVVERFGKPA